ncbi:MAG: 2-hydroxychromene-2-carboxylate isomerase [Alphaproteobacteria bacterium]
MAGPIEFYFDFSSPYGYLATAEIDALAARHHRAVLWRPILLGVVLKETGGRPLSQVPMKGDYMRRDVPRAARRLKLAFTWPAVFPFAALAASRAFYWLLGRDETLAKLFATAIFKAYFGDGRDMTAPEAVAEVASHLGVARDDLLAAIQMPAVKDRLRAETESAMKKGVFGSPFFIVDGEPFWGHDRIPELGEWLKSGGW